MEPESKTVRSQLNEEQWALIRDLFKPKKQYLLGVVPASKRGHAVRAPHRSQLDGPAQVLFFVPNSLAPLR